jgi:uncharacterized RmlC-like cupin family protein
MPASWEAIWLSERGSAMATDVHNPAEVDNQLIEDHNGISCVRSGAGTDHWNGLNYQIGLNARTVGTAELSMNVATVPPGGVAAAHIHVGFEVGLFILQGNVQHKFGKGLTQTLENGPGDFIFIKAGLPHEVFNLSDTEPIVAVVARSSANQWDEIIPYDPSEDA